MGRSVAEAVLEAESSLLTLARGSSELSAAVAAAASMVERGPAACSALAACATPSAGSAERDDAGAVKGGRDALAALFRLPVLAGNACRGRQPPALREGPFWQAMAHAAALTAAGSAAAASAPPAAASRGSGPGPCADGMWADVQSARRRLAPLWARVERSAQCQAALLCGWASAASAASAAGPCGRCHGLPAPELAESSVPPVEGMGAGAALCGARLPRSVALPAALRAASCAGDAAAGACTLERLLGPADRMGPTERSALVHLALLGSAGRRSLRPPLGLVAPAAALRFLGHRPADSPHGAPADGAEPLPLAALSDRWEAEAPTASGETAGRNSRLPRADHEALTASLLLCLGSASLRSPETGLTAATPEAGRLVSAVSARLSSVDAVARTAGMRVGEALTACLSPGKGVSFPCKLPAAAVRAGDPGLAAWGADALDPATLHPVRTAPAPPGPLSGVSGEPHGCRALASLGALAAAGGAPTEAALTPSAGTPVAPQHPTAATSSVDALQEGGAASPSPAPAPGDDCAAPAGRAPGTEEQPPCDDDPDEPAVDFLATTAFGGLALAEPQQWQLVPLVTGVPPLPASFLAPPQRGGRSSNAGRPSEGAGDPAPGRSAPRRLRRYRVPPGEACRPVEDLSALLGRSQLGRNPVSKPTAPPPTYLRTAIETVRSSSASAHAVLAALRAVPRLVRSLVASPAAQHELLEVAPSAASALLHLDDRFSIAAFHPLRADALLALATAVPFAVVPVVAGTVFAPEQSLGVRMDAVSLLADAAAFLAGLDAVPAPASARPRLAQGEPSGPLERSEPRVRRLKDGHRLGRAKAARASRRTDKFGPVARAFLDPVLAGLEATIRAPLLRGRAGVTDPWGEDALLLATLIRCAATMLECARLSPDVEALTARVWAACRPALLHEDAGVRAAAALVAAAVVSRDADAAAAAARSGSAAALLARVPGGQALLDSASGAGAAVGGGLLPAASALPASLQLAGRRGGADSGAALASAAAAREAASWAASALEGDANDVVRQRAAACVSVARGTAALAQAALLKPFGTLDA